MYAALQHACQDDPRLSNRDMGLIMDAAAIAVGAVIGSPAGEDANDESVR